METAVLQDLGLNESEIKVYLALLELDSSSVGPIYEKARVPDSKIYSILEKLKEKGLVSFVVKNGVKHFRASSPRNLVQMINERERKLEEQKKEIVEKIIPEIEARRRGQEEKQEAVVYEGFEGLKSAFGFLLDSLKKGEEYFVFTLGDELKDEKIVRFFQNYHKRRIEKGVKAKLVCRREFRDFVKKNHSYKGMAWRFSGESFPVGTFIFEGYVMTVVFGEKPVAFLIKSKKNYEYYQGFFWAVWEKSKS